MLCHFRLLFYTTSKIFLPSHCIGYLHSLQKYLPIVKAVQSASFHGGHIEETHSSRWWASFPGSSHSPSVESRFTQQILQPSTHHPECPGLQSDQSELQLQAWLGSVHIWLHEVSIRDLSGTNMGVFFYYVHLFEMLCMSKHSINA